MGIIELVAWWEGLEGQCIAIKKELEEGSEEAGGRAVKKRRKDGGIWREGAGGRGLLNIER